jgi:hypothetical protein
LTEKSRDGILGVMNIQDIIQKVTDFILHFSPNNYKNPTKVVVIIFAAIAALIILFGAVFSLIPQF